MKPMVIGICGGTGSGKSYVVDHIRKSNSGRCTVLGQDNYYKPLEEQQTDENGEVNFDLASSIYVDDYIRDIKKLKSGESFERMEYTYNNPAITPALLRFKPNDLIIIEGILIFHFYELRSLLDLKVFVYADEAIKLQRRIKRDWEERGYGLENVLYKYANHVTRSYRELIEPHMYNSDMIITNNQGFPQGLNILDAYIKDKLNDQ